MPYEDGSMGVLVKTLLDLSQDVPFIYFHSCGCTHKTTYQNLLFLSKIKFSNFVFVLQVCLAPFPQCQGSRATLVPGLQLLAMVDTGQGSGVYSLIHSQGLDIYYYTIYTTIYKGALLQATTEQR